MYCFPSFAQDKGSQSKGSDRVSPRFTPDGVHYESHKSNPRHVTAESGFRSVRLQSGARRDDCQLSFPAGEPRHHNSSGQQDSYSDQATPRLAVSDKIQDRGQHHSACQREKQAPSNSSCPRLTQRKAKAQKHTACRKQLNQAVPTESQQRRTVRGPSRPESDDGFHAHPDHCYDLDSKNFLRDLRERSCRRGGHRRIKKHFTPFVGRKADAPSIFM